MSAPVDFSAIERQTERQERGLAALAKFAASLPAPQCEPQTPDYLTMLRDEFAGKALAGICAHPDAWGAAMSEIPGLAYQMADAMLAARSAQS